MVSTAKIWSKKRNYCGQFALKRAPALMSSNSFVLKIFDQCTRLNGHGGGIGRVGAKRQLQSE